MVDMCIDNGDFLLWLPVIKGVGTILFVNDIRVAENWCVSNVNSRRRMSSYSLGCEGCTSVLNNERERELQLGQGCRLLERPLCYFLEDA